MTTISGVSNAKPRIYRCLAAVAAATALITACSNPLEQTTVFKQAAVDKEKVQLGDTVIAFTVGPSNHEMSSSFNADDHPGYVVLIDDRGNVSTIETTPTDLASLAWNERGLHFADDQHDYRLDAAGLTVVDNPKSYWQNLMFALDTGETVGVFNDGHTEDGYANQVAVTAGEHSETYAVEGNYFGGADCNGQVFGLAADPGTHATEAAALPGMRSDDATATPHMLARLYPPSSSGREEVIAWRDAFDVTVSGALPCIEDELVFLAADKNAEGNVQAAVVSWNVDTGESRSVPVSFTDTAPLDPYIVSSADYNALSLADGRLSWVADDGRVFTTDVETGATEAMFDTGLDHQVGGDQTSIWTFSESKIHAIEQDYRNEDEPVTYHTFDRVTGETTSFPIGIDNDEVNRTYLQWWRMAARPE